MKYFKGQYSLDFEQAIWVREPELLIMDQILDQNPQIIMLAVPCDSTRLNLKFRLFFYTVLFKKLKNGCDSK